jgi:hypothetical protein
MQPEPVPRSSNDTGFLRARHHRFCDSEHPMLGLWTRYEDWGTGEEIKGAKRLAACWRMSAQVTQRKEQVPTEDVLQGLAQRPALDHVWSSKALAAVDGALHPSELSAGLRTRTESGGELASIWFGVV